MQDIRQRIKDLERDVLSAEREIAECAMAGYHGGVKKLVRQLETDLKYLSILANGAPINRDEDMRTMEFLRIHYNKLREYALQVKRR